MATAMELELAQKIEGHLESIAGSLKVIAERTPARGERMLEEVYTSLLTNTGEVPTLNNALEHVRELEERARISESHYVQ